MGTTSFPVGEMLNKRTVNSKTWMNSDGTFTTKVHSDPIHFLNENGDYQNLSTDLFDEADFDAVEDMVSDDSATPFKSAKRTAKAAKEKNILNREDYNYQALKVPFELKLPKSFKKGYSIGKGQDKLTFTPVQASASKGELTQGDRSSIHYQDVWNDTDVELRVMPNGLKETFILKTNKAPSIFSFEVKGKSISDDLMAGELRLLPSWLIDAAGTYREVGMNIERINDNKSLLHIDADISDLVFPVEIDPTVVVSGIASIQDTHVDSANPTTNYNSTNNQNPLYVSYNVSNQSRRNAFLRFDLSSIPAGAVVDNATLRLYFATMYATPNTGRLIAKAVEGPWSETTLTWNTKPAVSNTIMGNPMPYSYPEAQGSNTHLFMDITRIIKANANEGLANNGFELSQLDVGESVTFATYNKHHAATYAPQLEISYSIPPTKPILTAPNGGEKWSNLHRVVWTAATSQITTTEVVTAEGGNNWNTHFAQSFKAEGTMLEKVEFTGDASLNYGAASVAIYRVGSTGLPEERITDFIPISGYIQNSGIKTAIFPSGVELVKNQNYALVVNNAGARNFKKTYGSENINTYTKGRFLNSYPNGSEFTFEPQSDSYKNHDIAAKLFMSEGKLPVSYEVQVSSNNGATWSNLFSATGTYKDFDFINVPSSSVTKLRIRAYNGSAYSDWDESNGVFTIIHNVAPNAPTGLTPNGGTPLDRAKVQRLRWTHSDLNNDPQAKFDLQWRLKGTSIWNTISQATVNTYYDISGLPYGQIEWRVRTYDQENLVSPYSDIALFLAANQTAKPTITSPTNNATVAVANPAITWSAFEQVEYILEVKNNTGMVVWREQKASTNKAATVLASLANQTAYSIELTTKNNDGLWSEKEIININVSYTPPAIPGLMIQGFDYEGKIRLMMTTPVPTGTQPTVTHHEVFRRKPNEEWLRIEAYAQTYGRFEDLTPGSGQTYEYFIRAWGNNGTYRDSSTVSSSIQLSSIWLLDPLDPESLHDFHYFEPGRTAERTFSGQLMEFEGRTQFMAEFSSRETNKVNMVLQLKKESDDLAALHNLLSRRTTLLYRDAKGRRLFGAIFVLSENETDYGYTVPVEVQAVSYEEEV